MANFVKFRPSAASTEKQDNNWSVPNKPARVLHFDQLPAWYQDNPFVRSGYRSVSHSVRACVDSWSYLHNETVNIWSHLLPAVGYLVAQSVAQRHITAKFPEATLVDRTVLFCYLFAATVCMGLSTSYHTLMNHSYPASLLWLRIDYVGILSLILGSFISGIYVGFFCEPTLQKRYWSMIVILSLITSILVLHPRLQGLKYRKYRTGAFVATGLSGFAPIGHGIFLYGWDDMWIRSGMPYWFLEGAIYGVGAFFFASRIPESIWPGRYDIWGSSHQIFHVLVVLGSLVHMCGAWVAFDWNYHNNRMCRMR